MEGRALARELIIFVRGHNPFMATTTYPPRCPTRQANGRMCAQKAGHRTDHPGLGPCRGHGGARSHVQEVWAMAQDIADEWNISPHEALLGLVRTASARAAWTDSIVKAKLRRHVESGGAPDDPPDGLVPWLRYSRDERIAAMRTAKSAVDAGVMVALERRLDMEGEVVADALGAVLDVLDLDHDQRVLALSAAQARLSGEPLPPPLVRADKGVEEPGDTGQAKREQEFRALMEADGIDPDELLDGDDEEEDGGV